MSAAQAIKKLRYLAMIKLEKINYDDEKRTRSPTQHPMFLCTHARPDHSTIQRGVYSPSNAV